MSASVTPTSFLLFIIIIIISVYLRKNGITIEQ